MNNKPETTTEKPPTPTVLAMDLVNDALQKLIATAESAVDQPLAIALANIKYQINQRFEREQRGQKP